VSHVTNDNDSFWHYNYSWQKKTKKEETYTLSILNTYFNRTVYFYYNYSNQLVLQCCTQLYRVVPNVNRQPFVCLISSTIGSTDFHNYFILGSYIGIIAKIRN